MSKELPFHYHISTQRDYATPAYPDKDARHWYLVGCARYLHSSKQGEEYHISQFEHDLDKINCKPCKVWATQLFKNGGKPKG